MKGDKRLEFHAKVQLPYTFCSPHGNMSTEK